MKDELLKNCIKNERLELSFGERVNHFGLPALFLMIPVLFAFLHLYDHFRGESTSWKWSQFPFVTTVTILGLASYLMQKRRLKFHVVSTNLTQQGVYDVIKNVATRMNWAQTKQPGKLIVLDTHPSYLDWHMGDKITIIVDGNRVLVNSICDPARKASLLGFGRHRQNIAMLVDEITKASR